MHRPESASLYRVYRNILLVLARGAIILLAGIVILVSMVLYATHTLSGADTASKTAAEAATGIGVLLVWIAIRVAGSRISAGPDGLFVHKVFRRTSYVPWEDVISAELIPAPRFNNRFTGSAVAVAVIRDHDRPLYCLGASFSERAQAADTMLSALQSQHQSWLNGHRSNDRATVDRQAVN